MGSGEVFEIGWYWGKDVDWESIGNFGDLGDFVYFYIFSFVFSFMSAFISVLIYKFIFLLMFEFAFELGFGKIYDCGSGIYIFVFYIDLCYCD
jgi:hypothetical protein